MFKFVAIFSLFSGFADAGLILGRQKDIDSMKKKQKAQSKQLKELQQQLTGVDKHVTLVGDQVSKSGALDYCCTMWEGSFFTGIDRTYCLHEVNENEMESGNFLELPEGGIPIGSWSCGKQILYHFINPEVSSQMGGFGNVQNEQTGSETLFTSLSLVKMIAFPGVTYFTEGGCRGLSETTTASENVTINDLASDDSSVA